MNWEKKICVRITARRLVGAILMTSIVVNLVIVGAAFEAAAPFSTSTAFEISLSPTQSPTAATVAPANTAGAAFTPTSTATITLTPSPTDTIAPPPMLDLCVLRSFWPVYRVRPGDTLSSIARATGSSPDELRLANCLPNTWIYAGQLLYVPRLPSPTFTPTSTATETSTATSTYTPITPTDTPTQITITPTDSPTIFQNPSLCYYTETINNEVRWYIQFSVTATDVDGLLSVVVSYAINQTGFGEVTMALTGTIYVGSAALTTPPSIEDSVAYRFTAQDTYENVIHSDTYGGRFADCLN